MTLLTDSDKAETDRLGERIRQMHRIPAEWDDAAPFTPEETSRWLQIALGIAGCLVLLFITAVALVPHI